MRTVDLGGQWQVRQAGENEAIPATAPGCVHLDLLAAGLIGDPFYRDDEDHLQWIGRTDWIYTRTFTADAALLAHDRVLLRCDGLDTLATLTLNGVEIGTTDNMFRAWEFDVKPHLRAGENTLEITFAAAEPYCAEKNAVHAVPGWFGPKEPKGRAWLRKEPCNFGWDWGPVFVTCGVWRPIALVACNTARLADVHITQDHANAPRQVTLTIAVQADAFGAERVTVYAGVSRDGARVADGTAAVVDGRVTLTLAIDNPALWWPNNLGDQPLYDVEVVLSAGVELDRVTKRIGLRTLRLDRHPDQWGESFQFVVNGVPYFAKGANWIPADSFAPRLTREDYRRLIGDAAAANMTMLRVWGGGIYEDDVFYELCDEMGITLWQDFMFACSTYPAFDDAFLDNVREEARDNVRRLRHHPCIALWCGNNELEQGLVGPEWNDHQMSWADYGRLFDTLLPAVVAELDPARDYWPCSPHTPGADRTNFNDPTQGDAHLWSVWHGRQPFEWYRTCEHRFNSEFGFQSFPEPKTVYGYTAPDDRNVTTWVMEHHQRSGIGNTVIMQYMLDWFRLPTSFEDTLWLSQILQGMAMKYAVEHWRRAMPRGMGTLYWQLNDCWPVASWASIDYHGRWKALHHMARAFNAPLLVSGVEDIAKGTVEVHVTNDRRDARAGTLAWTLTDALGTPLANDAMAIEAPALANALVTTLDLSGYLEALGPRNALLWLELEAEGEPRSTNLVLFARPKHIELADPGITVAVDVDGDAFTVTLTAERAALWTWLTLRDADARLSDNFVHLRPGVPAVITLRPAQPLSVEEVRAQLVVNSLVDTYQVGREIRYASTEL